MIILKKDNNIDSKKKEKRCGKVIVALIITIFVYKFLCIQMIKSGSETLATIGNNLIEYYDAVAGVINAYLTVIIAKQSFSLD